jgi:EAL domain-containing protein (putative c-di-GMP-specific phosphodiesterase class I)
MRRTAGDGRTRRVVDEVFWRKDGTRLPVEYTATPVYDGEVLAGAVITFYPSARVLDEPAEKLAAELRAAIADGDLVLHYQPKIELATDEVVGVEALVRWQHPRRGLLFPDEFIGIAERHGVINDLTAFVLDAAASQHARWRAAGHRLPVAVNLATESLLSTDLPAGIMDVCRKHRIGPDALELEITETTELVEPEVARDVLLDLVHLGFTIALDDFGTGFSSLSYLRDLPADVVKIDKSFVLPLSDPTSDARMVRGTVALVHSLGKHVVAEGVETAQARDLLLLLGCEQAQGYYWSPAVPADTLIGWIQQRSPEPPTGIGTVPKRASA